MVSKLIKYSIINNLLVSNQKLNINIQTTNPLTNPHVWLELVIWPVWLCKKNQIIQERAGEIIIYSIGEVFWTACSAVSLLISFSPVFSNNRINTWWCISEEKQESRVDYIYSFYHATKYLHSYSERKRIIYIQKCFYNSKVI